MAFGTSSPRELLANAFGAYLSEAQLAKPVYMSLEGKTAGAKHYARDADEGDGDLARFYRMQTLIRPMFGKVGYCEPDIGDHPDFAHLKGTDGKEYCPIVTMFMDIEGSTRLGLLYAVEDVFRIKNAIIRAAIEVIGAFGGHVHRIMGDAVMAYFGGKNTNPEVAAVDGLNCAALLRALGERVVLPKLAEQGFRHSFGIRIGLDYGPKDKVLWASYGYPNSDEVTATSFYVDVAAKLQGAAGRHQVMIGESLRAFLDLHDEILSVKTVTQQGAEIQLPYIVPNHTSSEGIPANYRQHVFLGDRYLELGPLGQHDRKLIGVGDQTQQAAVIPVYVEQYAERKGQVGRVCPPCSSPVPKDKWLRFTTRFPYVPRLPYTINCLVENHGDEALRVGGENRGNHETSYSIKTRAEHDGFEHWETTSYRGLHYLTIDVRGHGARFTRTVGIFVN
jgi:class 3 adenylate cyclase